MSVFYPTTSEPKLVTLALRMPGTVVTLNVDMPLASSKVPDVRSGVVASYVKT